MRENFLIFHSENVCINCKLQFWNYFVYKEHFLNKRQNCINIGGLNNHLLFKNNKFLRRDIIHNNSYPYNLTVCNEILSLQLFIVALN